MTKAEFSALTHVSRETLARLEIYVALLNRWQKAINLVGPGTLADPWRRHLLDSAQLVGYIPKDVNAIYDLGSGAGLPGIILAILGCKGVHLVESDHRKAQFLREAGRQLDLDLQIHAARIETLPAMSADVVTARALAPLPRLIDLASGLLKPKAICLFLKGRNASDELTEARKCWRMTSEFFPSLSDPAASVLKLQDIERAPFHRQ